MKRSLGKFFVKGILSMNLLRAKGFVQKSAISVVSPIDGALTLAYDAAHRIFYLYAEVWELVGK